MEKEIDINNNEQILKECDFNYFYNCASCPFELCMFYIDINNIANKSRARFDVRSAFIYLGRIAITLNQQKARIKELEEQLSTATKYHGCDILVIELRQENQKLKQQLELQENINNRLNLKAQKYYEDAYDYNSQYQNLKEEIKQLKFDCAMYKSANYLINDVGIDKAREIMFQSEQKLKQSQNQKAIEVLEQLRRDIWTDQQDDGCLNEKVDLYYLSETIDNQIKNLKEGK